MGSAEGKLEGAMNTTLLAAGSLIPPDMDLLLVSVLEVSLVLLLLNKPF